MFLAPKIYVTNNFDWILHEAFCLEKEEPIFKAREKNHSVVKDVAEKMEMMKAKNLILWHTIDNDIKNRKTQIFSFI